MKLDRGLCSHERNTLSDNNVLFPSWTEIGPLSVYHIMTAYKWCYPGVVTGAKHLKGIEVVKGETLNTGVSNFWRLFGIC